MIARHRTRSNWTPIPRSTCVLDARAELGECPVWSVPEQVLYWIDIRAPAMHRLDPGDRGEPDLAAAVPGRVVRAARDRWRCCRAGRRVPPAGLRHRRGDLPDRPGARAGHPVQRRQGLTGRPVLGRHHGRGTAVPADRRAVPARPRRHRAPDGRGPDRVQRFGVDRRRPHHVPLRQQGPDHLGLRLRPEDRRHLRPPGRRPAHRTVGSPGRRRRRPGRLLLERRHLRRRAEPLEPGRPIWSGASRCRVRTRPPRASAGRT